MAGFSIKKLEVSEPITMYDMLQKAIQFGESHATSKIQDQYGGDGYLLGGLEVSNLNSSGVSEETIAKLSNALEAGNINYAVFPDDQRKGRLPLILDKNSRLFIESTLNELVESKTIKWYLYKLPTNIDPDNNETRGSSFVLDDDEHPVEIKYDQIHRYIERFGFVEQQEDDSVFMSEEEQKAQAQEQEQKKEQQEDAKNQSNEDDTQTESEVSQKPKEDNQATNSVGELDYYENIFEDADDEDFENEEEEQSEFDDEDTLEFSQMFDEKVADNDKVEQPQNNIPQQHNEEHSNEMTSNDNDQHEKLKQDEIKESAKAYVTLPEEVQALTDNIQLPRFTDYPTDGLYEVTTNTMKKEVNDANNKIEALENQIKQKAIQYYRSYMSKSNESIAKVLNRESGSPVVQESYRKVLEDNNKYDNDYDVDVEERKAELESSFYGEKFDNYKKMIEAQIPQWFENEHYGEYVKEPLNEYANERKQEYDDRKLARMNKFDVWVGSLEEIAIGKDQQDAMQRMSEFIQNEVERANININEYQKRMDTVNHSLAQTEYQERATENIRASFGTQLKDDQQAQVFKRERDTALSEKASLDTAFSKFKQETEKQKQEMQEKHQQKLDEIDKKHTQLIEKYEKDKEQNDKERRNYEERAVKAQNTRDKHAKQTGLKFGGIAALATAIVVGGCSMVTNHSSSNENTQKIEDQQKQIEKNKKDLKAKDQEIKDKEQEIKEQKASKDEKKSKKSKKDKD